MAAIGFMLAVGHWNEWQTSFIYISPEKTTLQLLMIRIQDNIEFLLQQAAKEPGLSYTQLSADLPDKSARMAIMLVVEGPIFLMFPFFQKYFIKGADGRLGQGLKCRGLHPFRCLLVQLWGQFTPTVLNIHLL